MDLPTAPDIQPDSGDARDKIAGYPGAGRTTIERVEAVVEAPEEQPEEFGHLLEQMDRSGKVAGAFCRLTVMRQARRWTPVRRHRQRVRFRPSWPIHRGDVRPTMIYVTATTISLRHSLGQT